MHCSTPYGVEVSLMRVVRIVNNNANDLQLFFGAMIKLATQAPYQALKLPGSS
jgi:hypothetical protein